MNGVISLLLRLLITLSVFDIYFKSPLVQVPEPAKLEFHAPARRVVIFVADGLRARSFYVPHAAPYLHHVGNEVGVLGISHTQVPTESRPGHVAMLAGFYEDPSAITRGWTENPVEFDSVLNRSTHTWSWGSPDILNMFNKDGAKINIDIHTYGAELEDFSSKDSSYLDTWVFQKVEEFFLQAKVDADVQIKLRQKGNLFFLHLLGCDTNGHTNKPESDEYKQNIDIVNDGIRRTVDIVNDYFRNDGRTAFIFTADHGMTNWGSHGTGMDDETLTPFVAWGAGIKSLKHYTDVEMTELMQDFDEFAGSIYKIDVRQADIAPLISILLGNNIPTNSVGMLPFTILDMHAKHVSQALEIQFNQLLAQYTKLLVDHEDFHLAAIFHQEFPNLPRKKIIECEAIIKHQIKFGHYNESISTSMGCIHKVYEGITYYQRYQKNILKLLISLTLVFSILADFMLVWSFVGAKPKYEAIKTRNPPSLRHIGNFVFVLLLIIAWLCQKLPFHFLLYYISPCYTLHRLQHQWQKINIDKSDLHLAPLLPLAVVMCEIIVMAFFDRRFLTIGMLIFGAVSPKKKPLLLGLLVVLGIFSWLPPIDGRQQLTELVFFVAILNSIVVHMNFKNTEIKTLYLFLVIVNIMSGFCVFYTSKVDGLNPLIQMFVWLIFLLSLPVVIMLSPDLKTRLFAVIFSLEAMYSLLSLSYESLFLFTLSLFIMVWIKDETRSVSVINPEITMLTRSREESSKSDVLSFIRFFFLVFYSFFGTGNIASLNSFDPGSIRCFVAVFNPFLMGGLLLIKVLIPIFVFGVVYAYIVQTNKIKAELVQALLQLFSDFLTLHFFHLVQDSGSWLDIGSSLSHFIIVEGTSLFLALLLYASKFILNSGLKTKLSSD